MGVFSDRIQAQISDIETKIATETSQSAERLKALNQTKAALEETAKVLSKDVEDAVLLLQKHGYLKGL